MKEEIGYGYKLFRINKDGKLFPLYVNTDEEIPIGIWIKAKTGTKLENGKVKSKLGPLAYRPGWHINDKIPYVSHIYSVHENKKYMKDGTVWAKVYYHTNVNYQDKANKAGTNKNGIIIPKNSYLKEIPINGYYKYKTSPSMTGEWVISGEMMIERIMNMEEVRELCNKYGYTSLEPYKKKRIN